ncbi:HEPN domain-containing protein [uncultured Parabacteroides sp.]|uniref:HEPN domain-containing protein n=1 Tax=uncultured Parabacteroides sp. TaxID=512312 RepID=UPI00258FACD6|nr:HEPN domain-containing protein [uncultured Parabacteroides sp.]
MIDNELRYNIVNYRLSSARNALGEVLSLSKDGYFNAAISRLYYACFHAASALLINAGIEARTHTGVRQMLGKEFVQTGILSRDMSKFYTNLYSKRQNSDYEDFINYTVVDIDDLYPQAVEFIDVIEAYIRK